MINFIALAISVFITESAFAKPEPRAVCTLKVDGVYYMKSEKCVVHKEEDGGFSLGASENKKTRSKYFAYVVLEDGKASGTWNGKEAETRAQEDLGDLTDKHDGCWSNERATVCAK